MLLLFRFLLCTLMLIGCGDHVVRNYWNVEKANIKMVGNSMFAWNDHGIRKELDELYNWKGEKAVVTDYAFIGATAHQIQNQWFRAKEDGIDITIMDGGANNVFLNAWWCWTEDTLPTNCEDVVNNAMETLKNTIIDMQASGVKKVVLIIPYHLRGPASRFNLALEYAIPRLKEMCQELSCTAIELAEWIKPEDGSLYFLDGVHPSPKGSRRIARVVYNVLNHSDVNLDAGE